MVWMFGKKIQKLILPKKKVVWPENWKLIPIAEVMSLLDYDKPLNIPLLRKGCELLDVPYAGGGIYFFNKCKTLDLEMENLKERLISDLNSENDYVIAYAKEDKKHPISVFYRIVAIRSNDVLELKRALKVHKLKAFL